MEFFEAKSCYCLVDSFWQESSWCLPTIDPTKHIVVIYVACAFEDAILRCLSFYRGLQVEEIVTKMLVMHAVRSEVRHVRESLRSSPCSNKEKQEGFRHMCHNMHHTFWFHRNALADWLFCRSRNHLQTDFRIWICTVYHKCKTREHGALTHFRAYQDAWGCRLSQVPVLCSMNLDSCITPPHRCPDDA